MLHRPEAGSVLSRPHRRERSDLCQSVAQPTPIGTIVLKLTAGDGGTPAHADHLLIDMTQLSGDATFSNINIGQDASTLDADNFSTHGAAGGFGQQASHVTITGLQQVAYSTTASTFKLTGMSLKLYVGNGTECFATPAS